jgi:hypothetical protein
MSLISEIKRFNLFLGYFVFGIIEPMLVLLVEVQTEDDI